MTFGSLKFQDPEGGADDKNVFHISDKELLPMSYPILPIEHCGSRLRLLPRLCRSILGDI